MTSRTSVVTGANRGIGLELTRRLIARGDRVVGTARNVGAATELAALGPAAILALDISNADSVDSFAHSLAAEVESVDLLINNAGVSSKEVGYDGPTGVLEIPASVMLAVTEVNAVGPMLVLRAAAPLLEAAEGAWVVNISSMMGSLGFGRTVGGGVAYKMSKAALNMVTVCAAYELADRGVRSIAVHPGWVRTDMGGPSGELDVEVSVSGILATIDALGPDDNGCFFRWDGTTHPW